MMKMFIGEGPGVFGELETRSQVGTTASDNLKYRSSKASKGLLPKD